MRGSKAAESVRKPHRTPPQWNRCTRIICHIGGDPNNLTTIYRSRLAEFDAILANCGDSDAITQKRDSKLEIPAELSISKGDHPAELRGPIDTASTLAENLLLEYTQGIDASSLGWGSVNSGNIRSLPELHTAASDSAQRTTVIEQLQASNLLDPIRRSPSI
jgi:4-phytase/acid phosphatase